MKNILIVLICIQIFTNQLNAQSYTEEHIIYSSNLQEERAISVSLPIDYKENKNKYPVLYVLDSEYIFDYATGTVDFLTNDFGYLPEMIVVGIPNTNRNRDLFVSLNPEDGYINFLNFLKKEVFPFISERYRINEFNILYGFSSGSGICSYLLATEPDLIRAYILAGSGIGKKFESILRKKVTNDTYQNNTFLYANTEEGFREPFLQRYNAVIDSIKPNNLNYKFEIVSESHTGAMQIGLVDGLKFIFSDFFIPDAIVSNGFSEIQSYYTEIKNNFNFEFKMPIGAINESSGFLYNNNKDDAIELLKYGVELYPSSSVLYGSLAEIYKSESQIELAKEYYKKAVEFSSENIQDYLKYRTLLNELSQ